MKLHYPSVAKHKPLVKLAESIFPAVRLEMRVDMETHILRFIVMRWSEAGLLTYNTEFDTLEAAVEEYNRRF